MPFSPAPARAVIERGLSSRAFPAAAIEVGHARGALWTEAFGRLTYDAASPICNTETMFDLASLTKVIATASLVMRAIAAGRLALDMPVHDLLRSWRGADREPVTLQHLLDHSSGLPAHARIWEAAKGRDAFERAIAAIPLERAPGISSVYSDLGFILLGFILEDIVREPLDRQFDRFAGEIDCAIRYRPDSATRSSIAPTEHDPWRGRLLQGEVHDENAAALDGVAAHAGLFGSVVDVGVFARVVLRTIGRAFDATTPLGSPELMRQFATTTGVPESSRALAWDTMRPTSSCGTRLSSRAIGHTGFTGTSLWIDPERDLYVAFLTNRVHPTRDNTALPALRAAVHDAVLEGFDQR